MRSSCHSQRFNGNDCANWQADHTRDVWEYKTSDTSLNRYLILNLSSSCFHRRRISKITLRVYSSSMNSLFDRFDAAEIIAATLVDAISVKNARSQLQSQIAVEVIGKDIDQRFTYSIAAEGCATFCKFLEGTLARLPLTLGCVYLAAMIACDETPVRCGKQSSEGTLSVGLVVCFCIRLYYAARQVFAMFNRRFDSCLITKRLSVCYVTIPHWRIVALTVAATQHSADASSLQALQRTTTQKSRLSIFSAVPRLLIQILSPYLSTPGSPSVVFGTSFFGGAFFSFGWPTRAHTSSLSSHPRTTLPVSSLFAPPAFNVTITPKSTAVTSSASTAVLSRFAMPSMAAAACRYAAFLLNARLAIICCFCCAVYHAIDCADSDARDGRPECADFLDFNRDDSLLKHSSHFALPRGRTALSENWAEVRCLRKVNCNSNYRFRLLIFIFILWLVLVLFSALTMIT